MAETIIKVGKKRFYWPFKDLWLYREMILALAGRDIKIRYQETILGVLWVIFQPTVVTTIFTIIFGQLAKIPSNGLPYPVFTYAGLIFWNFFSSGLSATSNSLSSASGLISKIAFPRVVLPFSAIINVAVDFFVSLIPLVLMILYFGLIPRWEVVPVFPLLAGLTALTSLGIGMFLAPVCIRYRDTRYLLNFLLQIGLFLTPIVYPLGIITDWKKIVLSFNPLAGIIETFRSFLGASGTPEASIFLAVFSSTVVFILGLWYFEREEKEVVDII